MTTRTYASPAAFKQALEQRLRAASGSGPDLARRRQLLVFDRFLARIVHTLGDTAMLEGGLVLELRLSRARTTKDIDLRFMGSPERALERLQEAARADLGDFLTFVVVPDDDHPEIQNDGMQYDGMRFRAECQLAGKLYGQPARVVDPHRRDRRSQGLPRSNSRPRASCAMGSDGLALGPIARPHRHIHARMSPR
jgi:hypothetical protein